MKIKIKLPCLGSTGNVSVNEDGGRADTDSERFLPPLPPRQLKPVEFSAIKDSDKSLSLPELSLLLDGDAGAGEDEGGQQRGRTGYGPIEDKSLWLRGSLPGCLAKLGGVRLNPLVTFFSLAVILAFVTWAILEPAQANTELNTWKVGNGGGQH